MSHNTQTKEHKRKIAKLSKMVDYRHSERWFQHVLKGVVFILGFVLLFGLSSHAGMIYGQYRRYFILALIFLIDFIAFEVCAPIRNWKRFFLYWPVLLLIFALFLGDCYLYPTRYTFPWWLRGFMAFE